MKVLVVDDELPIREWLKLTIQSGRTDLEVLTAGNGKEAWELCLKEMPGLIVTDIKMPRMDGLELLRAVKEREPGVYVVMLTSYGEFEYAREAIKYQANEYVLKNEITAEVISQLLCNFYHYQKKEAGETGKRYLKEQLEKGTVDAGLIQAKEHTCFFAVAFADSIQGKDSLEPYLNSFVERIEPIFYEEGISIWLCHCRRQASARASLHEAMSFCQKLSGLKEESVGFSGFCETGLDACVHARKAWNLCFYEKRRGVYSYHPDEEEAVRRLRSVRKQAVALLGQGRKQEALAGVQELFLEAEKARILDLELLYTCFQDLVDACKVANMEFAGHELEEICKRNKGRIREACTLEELKIVFADFFQELEGTMQIQEKPCSKYIRSALAYVADNYAVIESLAEVAGYVNLNTEYFCRMFKAEVGCTFNSYLTEYRIRKAVELLRRTDLKVYEVAEQVGYSNLSYFSRVFKKVTGENPFFYKR